MGAILSFGYSPQRSTQGEIDLAAEMKKPVNWKQEDIAKWMKKEKKFSEVFIRVVSSRVQTGNRLFSIKANDLRQIEFKLPGKPATYKLNRKEIDTLMTRIMALKKDPNSYVQLISIPAPPTSNEQKREATNVILKKLNAMKTNFSEEEKIKRGQNLIFKELLLQTYLSERHVGRQLREDLNIDQVSDDDDDEEEDEDETGLAQLEQPLRLSGYRLTVKLVIVEIHHSNGQRLLRKTLTPVINSFTKLAPQFGIFHSALIVGPWYLEWNDSSLCIPRRCYSQAAVIAADLSQPYVAPEVSVALNRMADIICDWNAKHTYDSQNYNCQTFVDIMCKALGIDISKQFPKDTAIGSFFEALRQKGSCNLAFKMSPQLVNITKDFIHNYKVSKNRIAFDDHHEIDSFVSEVTKVDPDYFTNTEVGQQDHFLLKSFDRAFWLRHYKNPDEKRWAPMSSGCAFLDPNVTKTMCRQYCTA